MRIDRLTIENFNGFKSCTIDFDPHFNLLVGDNASGKTTILDALAIGIDTWFVGVKADQRPGAIGPDHVRMVPYPHGETFTFEKQWPARIQIKGTVLGQQLAWSRELSREVGKNTTKGAKALIDLARAADQRVRDNDPIKLPLICSYGTERLWFEMTHRQKRQVKESFKVHSPSRLDGYRDCTGFCIQQTDLLDWIKAQVELGNEIGRETSGWRTMKTAIAACVEGTNSVYWDSFLKEPILDIERSGRQMFRNLSDGQRVMLTLVGDLVRRATTLNDLGEAVLSETEGIVLIDELDLHLHPKWQRRVINDLKKLFPKVQFIATTHSPQLIGEALPHEVRVLSNGSVTTPARSYGIDSSRVLTEIMHAPERNSHVAAMLSELARSVDQEKFEVAKRQLTELESLLDPDDADITGARTLITLMESSL